MNYDQNITIRKNSYLLAIIDKKKFVELGASPIVENELYFIKKEYDGTNTGETVAVIGISKNFLKNIHETIKLIKTSEKLSYIEDIDKITFSCSNVYVIDYFKDLILEQSNNQLYILNIEPKGQNITQLKFYPNPIISIPGGNMEIEDRLCFEKCAHREFVEETGIDIGNNYKIIGIHKHPILKILNTKHDKARTMSYPSYSRFEYIYHKYKKSHNTFIRIEKFYFLARIFIN
jgi:8-oxo-dGTP pyrophosphatase MutT (NUDIX family)